MFETAKHDVSETVRLEVVSCPLARGDWGRLVIVRAIVLNGLAGLVFGYLYFTRGLEAAMLSHFSGDLVLHVLFAIKV